MWAQGYLSLLVGDPGLGKSFVALDAAARISRGDDWPEGGKARQGNVCLLTAEDGLSDTVRPRLENMGADLNCIGVIRTIGNEGSLPRLDRDVDKIWRELRRQSAAALIIDPLSVYMGDVNSSNDEKVRRVLGPLAALAEDLRIAVLAIKHLNKNEERSQISRVGGSIGFVAAARSVFRVKEHPRDKDRRVITPIKTNHGHP
ncbi:MAG: AAA family ATPase, partial [Proteobacteria bacterium]|nr:AAA family ATPase [Pseudomonadota bacterium]